MKAIIYTFLIFILFGCSEDKESEFFFNLKGPYLGQKTPGNKPELFAPGIINRGLITRDIAMTPDGKEIYFTFMLPGFTQSAIMVTKQMNNKWAKPEVAWFSANTRYRYLEPCISPDGKTMFFVSDQAADTTLAGEHYDIWAMKRVDTDWAKPARLDQPVNTKDNEFFPSVTSRGTLYFTRQSEGIDQIYRSQNINGKYAEPELLPDVINCGLTRFNGFISPDESFLIYAVYDLPDSRGGADYYISFRNNSDKWSEPVNLGDQINTSDPQEYSASLSPDGKFLFFMSAANAGTVFRKGESMSWKKLHKAYNSPGNGNPCIFWVDASFLSNLKKH